MEDYINEIEERLEKIEKEQKIIFWMSMIVCGIIGAIVLKLL